MHLKFEFQLEGRQDNGTEHHHEHALYHGKDNYRTTDRGPVCRPASRFTLTIPTNTLAYPIFIHESWDIHLHTYKTLPAQLCRIYTPIHTVVSYILLCWFCLSVCVPYSNYESTTCPTH